MPWIDVVERYEMGEPASRKEKAVVKQELRVKSKARFYADENFPSVATEMLKRMGQDVTKGKYPGVNDPAGSERQRL